MVSGQIKADTLPLPLPYVRSPAPLPLQWLQGWQGSLRLEAAQVLGAGAPLLDHVAAQLDLAGSRLRVRGLTGRFAGGDVTGSATLDGTATPPRLAVQATVAGAKLAEPAFDLPWDLALGTIDASLDLRAEGYAPAAMLSTVTGSAHLAARDGAISGFDLAAATTALRADTAASPVSDALLDAALRTAMIKGTTPFASLDLPLTAGHGALTVGGRLSGPAGTAQVDGVVDLTGPSLELRTTLLPAVPNPPVLRLRLTGPDDAPAVVPELADLTRWLAARQQP